MAVGGVDLIWIQKSFLIAFIYDTNLLHHPMKYKCEYEYASCYPFLTDYLMVRKVHSKSVSYSSVTTARPKWAFYGARPACTLLEESSSATLRQPHDSES